ncbi:MAG: DUF2946 family protein [Proteobacteria bacterium]|nr:DUF2946 family protein [Pseudomonadota bacterium]
MDRNRYQSGWRASALAVALLAITINFLQPIAHAALIRTGAPSTLWSAICSAAAANPDGDKNSKQVPVDTHECCLGLAHATSLAPPPVVAIAAVAPIVTASTPFPAADHPSPVGIRDGPTRPRGPPSLA